MIETALDQYGQPVTGEGEQRYLLKVAVSVVAPAWTQFLYELQGEKGLGRRTRGRWTKSCPTVFCVT
jgi:hypothetical protein